MELRKFSYLDQKNRRKQLLPWLLISFIFHFWILWLLFSFQEEWFKTKPMEVEIVAHKTDPKDKQIVDIPEWGEKLSPDEARLLSKNPQRVKKETKSPRTAPKPWQDAVVQGALEEKRTPTLEGKDPLYKKYAPERKDLMPSRAQTDYLPEVELGEKTYINAEAFKHTTYYLEIKRKIEITWDPVRALRGTLGRGISIQRGILATYLGVTLRADGTLDGLVVLESSGVEPLDQEAKRAFLASAPFTRVPEPLLSPDDKLRFEFGFIVGR